MFLEQIMSEFAPHLAPIKAVFGDEDEEKATLARRAISVLHQEFAAVAQRLEGALGTAVPANIAELRDSICTRLNIDAAEFNHRVENGLRTVMHQEIKRVLG